MITSQITEVEYLLHIADTLEKCGIGPISGIWKRAARLLISSIVSKELIDEVSFDVIIKRAAEEGFVNVTSSKIELTPIGRRHLEAIKSRLKFSEEVEFQIYRLKDLPDDSSRSSYINELEEETKSVLEYVQKRKIPITDDVVLNAFLGEISGEVWYTEVTSKEYVTKTDFSGKGTLLNDLKKLCESKNIKLYYYLSYDKAVLIFDNHPNEVLKVLEEKNFEILKQPEKKDLTKIENCVYFLSQIVSDYLQSKGLVKIGNTFKFIDFSDTKEIDVIINNIPTKIKIFYGFNLAIELVGDNTVLLWIDPTYVEFFTMDKWVEFEGASSEKEILEKVSEVLVLPRRIQGQLVGVNLNDDISDLVEYWKRKYNLTLTLNRGVVKVKFKWRTEPLAYPLETVTFSKDWIEKNVGYIEKKDPTLPPDRRFRRVNEYFRKYFSFIKTNFCEIKFDEQILGLEKLSKIFIRESYKLLPPVLSFSKRDIQKQARDPRGIFKYGGYAGAKNIYITKIICPQYISSEDIEEFLISLKRIYDNIFGTLEYEPVDRIRVPYSQKILNANRMEMRDILMSKVASLSPTEKGGYVPLVLVVTPNRKNIMHYYLRQLINDYWKIPDQHLKESTFSRIKQGELPIIRAFALQLYIKSLKDNEAPWILRWPSDKAGKTIYCGIGYSMRTEEKNKPKKGIGIVICDAQGKCIFQKSLSLPQMSYYLSRELLDKTFNFIKEKIREIDFNRVVLYKKGHLTEQEKLAAEEFVNEIRKTSYWRDKEIDIVTIEESLLRLFKVRDGKIHNTDPGTVLILSDSESLVCTSGHPERGIKQGTAKLLELRVEVSTSGRQIGELTNEYYDRVFLNWMAPVNPSKYPLEVKVSSNIAEFIKEVEIKTMPSLFV